MSLMMAKRRAVAQKAKRNIAASMSQSLPEKGSEALKSQEQSKVGEAYYQGGKAHKAKKNLAS